MNPRGRPVSSSQGNRIDSESVIQGAPDSRNPGKWQIFVLAVYTLSMCGVGGKDSELRKIHGPASGARIRLRHGFEKMFPLCFHVDVFV